MSDDRTDLRFWQMVQVEELRSDRRRLWTGTQDDAYYEIAFTPSGLWTILHWGDGAEVAFRGSFSPGALRVQECTVEPDAVSVEIHTPIGRQTSRIARTGPRVLTLHTTLRAHGAFMPWPRDIVPLGPSTQVAGVTHTRHVDERATVVHASVCDPGGGSFLYLQDHAAAPVHNPFAPPRGGEAVWPDVGYEAVPALLASDTPAVVSHAHITWADEVPVDAKAANRQFDELLEAISSVADS